MKRTVLTILAVLAATLVFGQGKYGADSAQCIRYLSFYQQYMKQNNLEDAAPNWRKAIKFCPPTASQNMLLDGMKILRKEINQFRNNPIRKKELVDTLMMLHNMRVETYPKYAVTAKLNKAADMMNYSEKGSELDVFNALDDAMKTAKEKTSTTIAVRYMNYAVELYQSGRFTEDQVFEAFNQSMETLELVKAKKPSAMVDNAISDVENLFAQSGVASCENLVAVFEPRYNATPEDKALLSSIVTLFTSTNCTNTDLFRSAVEELHKVEPSSNSAHLLFVLYSSLPDGGDNAVKYMQEAIAFEDSPVETDAEYYFELASYQFTKLGRKADAVASALKAAELSTSMAGKAYFLVASIWSTVKCQGNDIEARAPFWVATDYMNKAKQADATLAPEADKNLASYRQYFPMQADAFMYNFVEGERYTVSCEGLSATTIIRTQK